MVPLYTCDLYGGKRQTLYEVIAGKVPYDGKTEMAIMYLVVDQKVPPERPTSISHSHGYENQLWELLVRCWSFEPASRPSVADVVESVSTACMSTYCM
ncbi:hypothetical protein B0J17DRAFT_659384, partial [Rhizoctonia solani]